LLSLAAIYLPAIQHLTVETKEKVMKFGMGMWQP